MKLITKRIVGFLDILGFKEAVNAEEETQYSAIYELLNKFALSNSEHQFNLVRPNDSSYTLSGSPAISSFSDHIVISFGDDVADISPMMLLHFICDKVAIICDYALKKGFLVRGGISYGNIIHRSNIVYGRALLEAMDIENSAAIYPRIVLSNSLLTALRNGTPPFSLSSHNFMFSQSELLQDADGLNYINWLGSSRLGLIVPEGVDIAKLSFEEREALLDQKLARYKEIIDRELLDNKPDIKKYKNWRWMQKYLLDFMASRERYKQQLKEANARAGIESSAIPTPSLS